MPLNTHGPSLVIGVAIAIASILSAVFVFGTGFLDELRQPRKISEDDNKITLETEKASEKIQNDAYAMSLFTANASPVLGSVDALLL